MIKQDKYFKNKNNGKKRNRGVKEISFKEVLQNKIRQEESNGTK